MPRIPISGILCRPLLRLPSRLTKTRLIVLTAAALLVSNFLLIRPHTASVASTGSADAVFGIVPEAESDALHPVRDESDFGVVGGGGVGVGGGGSGRYRRISQHLSGDVANAGGDRSVTVEAWSGCRFTSLAIDGVLLVNESTKGLHVFIVNQATASLMGHQVFQRLDQLRSLLSGVTSGRILILTSVPKFRRTGSADEAAVLKMLGSSNLKVSQQTAGASTDASWDTASWVLVAFAKIGRIKELRVGDGRQLKLRSQFRLVSEDDPICPSWPPGEETSRRRQFCQLAEGYNSVCDCSRPSPISFPNRPAPWIENEVVPLTVMSSDQPQFLFRTLSSLLSLHSVNLSQTHVMLRGFYEEPRLICDLLSLPYTQRKLVSPSLANLYRLGMAVSFQLFPTASFAILLEDDLDLSPDLIDFFNRTLPLMSRDPNLFCIGAWNDQSFTHTTQNPTVLHRTQQVPLKAVAIRRSTWESQLNEQWPEGPVDLTTWLTRAMGKRSYCLRPALSRVFVYSQSLSLINQLRPAYRTEKTDFSIDGEAQLNYDIRLQKLIDRSTVLNAQFARKCQSAVLAATSLASQSANLTIPSVILSARVASLRAAQLFWTRVARCFSLSPSLTCLYKGTCQINFSKFILIVLFRPMSPFRLPDGNQADLIIHSGVWRSRRRLGSANHPATGNH